MTVIVSPRTKSRVRSRKDDLGAEAPSERRWKRTSGCGESSGTARSVAIPAIDSRGAQAARRRARRISTAPPPVHVSRPKSADDACACRPAGRRAAPSPAPKHERRLSRRRRSRACRWPAAHLARRRARARASMRDARGGVGLAARLEALEVARRRARGVARLEAARRRRAIAADVGNANGGAGLGEAVAERISTRWPRTSTPAAAWCPPKPTSASRTRSSASYTENPAGARAEPRPRAPSSAMTTVGLPKRDASRPATMPTTPGCQPCLRQDDARQRRERGVLEHRRAPRRARRARPPCGGCESSSTSPAMAPRLGRRSWRGAARAPGRACRAGRAR